MSCIWEIIVQSGNLALHKYNYIENYLIASRSSCGQNKRSKIRNERHKTCAAKKLSLKLVKKRLPTQFSEKQSGMTIPEERHHYIKYTKSSTWGELTMD